jgi:hypothetical protein
MTKIINAFVLEDDNTRIKSFTKIFDKLKWTYKFTKEVKDAKRILSIELFDILFLDHDLGGEVYVSTKNSNTGSELARWIIDNPLKNEPNIIIHSLNTVGQRYMNSLLPESYIIPYIWIPEIFQKNINIKKRKQEYVKPNSNFK